jgi:ElaB/YqjD/DUF883 family membrane-anchored ribosome-binding protein
MAKEMSGKSQIQALKREVKILRSEMKKVPRRGGDGESRAATSLRRVWGAAREAQDRAQGGIAATYATVRDTSLRAADVGRKHVSRRPLTMLLLAIFVGVVVGQLVRRRRY